MTMDPDTTGIVDVDPIRPGVQILVDLWHVHMSEGSKLVPALTADDARREAVHSIIASGNGYPPAIKSVELATADVVAEWLEVKALLLDISPGPLPADWFDPTSKDHGKLDEARRKLGASTLAMYRHLTERAPSEATALPATPPPSPLKVPAEYNIDVARMVYMLRNMAWIVGWIVVALLPLLVRGVAYWVAPPVLADVWATLGSFVIESVVLGAVSFVWALLWFAGTHESLFARFNMWPDRGVEWSRDIGVK